MKKLFLLFFVWSAFAAASMAQIGLNNGQKFQFNNGESEWSEPLSVTLQALKGDKTIPVSIRVKYAKKMVFACHYLVEITNLSDKQSVKFSLGTGYTDYKGNDVVKKFKLKAGATKQDKIIYASGTKKPNGAEDCINNWSPKLRFFETKIK